MTNLIFYGIEASPPCRAVLLTLMALNVPFQFNHVNLMKGEHLSPEYLAKNPQHTVPALEDDGNFIWDSHAINAYLVSKYGSDDSLYPKDLLKRAVVDQRMYFEAGIIFQGIIRSTVTQVTQFNDINVSQSRIDQIENAYTFLEAFLKDNPYMAGNTLTIADFSLTSSITSLSAFSDIDESKYPKLAAWLKRMKELPYYEEANGKGAAMLIGFIKSTNFKIVGNDVRREYY